MYTKVFEVFFRFGITYAVAWLLLPRKIKHDPYGRWAYRIVIVFFCAKFFIFPPARVQYEEWKEARAAARIEDYIDRHIKETGKHPDLTDKQVSLLDIHYRKTAARLRLRIEDELRRTGQYPKLTKEELYALDYDDLMD